MASERKFVRENTNRVLNKRIPSQKIEGAGFGGMNIQRTPIGHKDKHPSGTSRYGHW